MKQEILKLNASYFPIGVAHWKSVMVDIITGVAFPLDIEYSEDKTKIEWFNVVRTFEEWAELPIREGDDYVNAVKSAYRLPPIVVCSKFNKIVHKKVIFPTKSNIWKRDNYTCQYSGKKLTKEELSIDHILPVSRGGKNTWENLVTCERSLNTWKADRTPREANLKLLSKPVKPTNGMVFSFVRDEWKMFVDSGEHAKT